MLVHSSTMAVRNCWKLAGTGTRCRIRRSRASQTCSIPAPTGSPRLLPGRCTVGCPLLQVCTLGWVKCREHISLLIILCIIVYVTSKAHPSLICLCCCWMTVSMLAMQELRSPHVSASRNCVQILATLGRALSCCNMRRWSWMNGKTMGLRISSRYLCAFKMPSIKCTCVCCP